MSVPSKRRTTWRALGIGVLFAANQAVAIERSVSPSQTGPASTAPFPADKLEQVLRWSLGPGDRVPADDAPKPSGTGPLTTKPRSEEKKPDGNGKPKPISSLLLVPLGANEKPRELLANRAVSFLPSPTDPAQVYLIIAGQLHVLDTRSGTTSEIPASSQLRKGLRLHRLLGYSTTDQLLVELELPDSGGRALWQLTLQRGQYTGEPAPDTSVSTRDAFFATFRVPRCQKADRDCLVVKQLGARSYVSKEHQADSNTKPLALVKDLSSLRCNDVYGATWASATALYVLARCDSQKQL